MPFGRYGFMYILSCDFGKAPVLGLGLGLVFLLSLGAGYTQQQLGAFFFSRSRLMNPQFDL